MPWPLSAVETSTYSKNISILRRKNPPADGEITSEVPVRRSPHMRSSHSVGTSAQLPVDRNFTFSLLTVNNKMSLQLPVLLNGNHRLLIDMIDWVNNRKENRGIEYYLQFFSAADYSHAPGPTATTVVLCTAYLYSVL
jgi:hypothetical protein